MLTSNMYERLGAVLPSGAPFHGTPTPRPGGSPRLIGVLREAPS
jgi:hypothetical protein